MELIYTKEFTMDDFEWWSGGNDTYTRICGKGVEEEAEEILNTYLFDYGNIKPTETEINDFMWFEMDDLLKEEYGIDIWAD